MNVCCTTGYKRLFIGSRFVLAMIAFSFFVGAKGRAEVAVESYQSWKNARIEEAQSQLERLQSKQEISLPPKSALKTKEGKATTETNATSSKTDAKLRQAQENLDIARELTVNDYFLLYLRQFREREAFIEAAKKLSPEELADLLMAYQKNVSGDVLSLDVPIPAAQLRSDSSTSK